ncbi:MAG: thioesterase [Rikenellaceae bacterium]
MITTININPRDVDFLGFLTPKTIVDIAVSVAFEDSENEKNGISELLKHGYSWVLSSLVIEIERFPKFSEKITINTWIEKMNRIYSYRNIQFIDEKGEVIIRVNSNWSIIDFKERKLANITKILDTSTVNFGESMRLEPLNRVTQIVADRVEHYKVTYSDIDMNHHVTSSKYMEWICNVIEKPFETLPKLKRIDISYMHESVYGEEIAIECKKEQNSEYFTIRNEADELLCCSVLTFK